MHKGGMESCEKGYTSMVGGAAGRQKMQGACSAETDADASSSYAVMGDQRRSLLFSDGTPPLLMTTIC